MKRLATIPALPTPETALPATNAAEDAAAPLRREPASKMHKAVRKTFLVEKTEHILPNMNGKAHDVNRLK